MSVATIATAEAFGQQLEEYFGKRYTLVQVREIKRWAAKRSPRVRYLIYRSLVETEKFLPLIATMNAHLLTVYEGHPELDAARADDARQITDDAGWTDEEMDKALSRFRSLAGRLASEKRMDNRREAHS